MSENTVHIKGRVVYADVCYLRKTGVVPIARHYNQKNEPEYIKYSCPVCEMLGNKHQVLNGTKNCSLCNVNLVWEDEDCEEDCLYPQGYFTKDEKEWDEYGSENEL